MAKARKDNKGRALRKGETYRKSDNSYMYKYVDPQGQKKCIYAKDLAKLREREKQLEKDQLDGLDVYVAGNATINFVFDRYISTKTELRSTTRSNYIYMYDHFIRDGFGQRKIAEVKYSDVLYFYLYLMNEKGMMVNTLETIHTVLHPTFELAVKDDIIRKNPSHGVMTEVKRKPGKNHGVRHALTVEQQKAFIDYIAESPVHCRWHPLFTVMLGTGMRIGEVLGLRWDDVDLEKRTVNVNHSITYYPRSEDSFKCDYEISLPKTDAGIRNIPIIDPVYDAFIEEKEYQKEYGGCISEIDGMDNFIFCNRFNMVQNPSAVNRAIRRISENYNAEEIVNAKKQHRDPILLPHFSCHHLRHTFCTRFCENETNIKVIQSVMGHANIETTMDIYAEATESKKQESMVELAKRISDIL